MSMLGSMGEGIGIVLSRTLLKAREASQGRATTLTTLWCQQPGTLVVRVFRSEAGMPNAPLPGAQIEILEAGVTATSQGGPPWAVFTLPPGNYTVRASLGWYLPDGGAMSALTNVAAAGNVVVDLVLEESRFHLHVDADRDGVVDDDRANLGQWAWGAGGRGAVVLCNNDCDTPPALPPPTCDNAAGDTVVNTAADLTDIAPLDVRRQGTAQPPATWAVTLSIPAQDQGHLRVFAGRAAGNEAEIIGPGTGAAHTFPNGALTVARLELGMEALRYAGAGFAGEVVLTLTVSKPATGLSAYVWADESYTERARVRVAPWIVHHHNNAALEVHVADRAGANQAFRNALQAMVTGPPALAAPLEIAAGGGDKWMQDCMEIGYSQLPGQAAVPSVLRMPPAPGLEVYPPTLLAAGTGYHVVGAQDSTSAFDAGGNLEATPPAHGPSKDYPLGRIYYCSGRGRVLSDDMPPDFARPIDPDLEALYAAQVVQEPFELDSSWLVVGHVDEMISFVPAPDVDPLRRFRLLVASPRRAMTILDHLNTHGSDQERLLVGTPYECTVADFLANGLGDYGSREAIEAANHYCQVMLDRARAVVEHAITVPGVIEVPVLFMEQHGLPGLYEALTADMVNMLVLNTHCIIPQARGPGPRVAYAQPGGAHQMDAFEAYLEGQLQALGLTSYFLDDWASYHLSHGEVHCGTNTRRQPPVAPPWWHFVP